MRQAEYQHPDPIICPLVKDCTDIKNIHSFRLPISNSEEPKKAGRNLLTREYEVELVKLKAEIPEKFGDKEINFSMDLIPNA